MIERPSWNRPGAVRSQPADFARLEGGAMALAPAEYSRNLQIAAETPWAGDLGGSNGCVAEKLWMTGGSYSNR